MSQHPRPHQRRQDSRASTIGGPHELGQNWLVDRRYPAEMADVLRHAPPYPVLELGAGNGALTEALVELGMSVTALELDPRRVHRLRKKFEGRARIVQADLLTYDFDRRPHHVAANVPFHLTSPLLRRLLRQSHWDTAVLLLQWEVARKRAAVGGTTMLTATWWPWYEFALGKRVPARAFAPMPSVDGGILVIRRRAAPFLAADDRPGYQDFVRHAFTGPGRGLPAILRRQVSERVVRAWMIGRDRSPRTLPRDLNADDWVALYRLRR